MPEEQRFQSFKEFYTYYLSEHQLFTTRLLHVIGTGLALVLLMLAFIYGSAWYVFYGVICGYFFAWVGHFFFEKNKPATFRYPLWSLMSDFKFFFEVISGKRSIRP